LEALNRCRIFLQVLTLSDITSADGRQLIVPILNGNKLVDRRSNLTWPVQQRPPPSDWRVWSSALSHLHKQGKLHTPLTTWTASSHQSWFWFMDPATHTLFYQASEASWQATSPLQSSSRGRTRTDNKKQYQKSALQQSEPPEDQLVPISILEDPSQDLVTPNIGQSPLLIVSDVQSNDHCTLLERISAHPFYRRIIGPLRGPVEEQGECTAESIISGSLLACSDGSYSPLLKKGSHGWVLATEQKTIWRGAGPVDGHPELINPYRAELSCLISVFHILLTVCCSYNISSGAVMVYCDCLSAVKHLNQSSILGLKGHLVPDYDLLNEGRDLLLKLKKCCQVTVAWVKGHFKGNNKSIGHRLNDIAHELASSYSQQNQRACIPQKLVLNPPSYEVSIIYNGASITSRLAYYISHALYSKALQDNICKNEGWHLQTFNKVDWKAYQKALQATTRSHKISLIKISHKLLNTNHQNKKYYDTPDTCPCCNQHGETFAHMLTCNANTTSTMRETQQHLLKTKLSAISTPELVIEAIIAGIKQWEQQQVNPDFEIRAPTFGSCHPKKMIISQAFVEQTREIGWENFFRGRVSKLWGAAYTYNATHCNGHNSALTWSSELITYILAYSATSWDTRNKILHGNTLADHQAKLITSLSIEITAAYEAFSKDPFIVPSTFCSIFTSKTLTQRLHLDVDSMQCWLRSYKEGVLTQEENTRRQAAAARTFFLPRSKTKLSSQEVSSATSTNLSNVTQGNSMVLSVDSDETSFSDVTSLGTKTSIVDFTDSSIGSVTSDGALLPNVLSSSDTSCCSLELSISSVESMVDPNV
jgi:hypothetical protein